MAFKKHFLPFLERTSMLFNILEKNKNFQFHIKKIQARIADAGSSNRAKLNYLMIKWD